MKKYAIVLTAVLLLTGCIESSQNSSENDNTVPVSYINPNIESIVSELRQKDFDNLDLSDIQVEFPDISEYHNINLSMSSDMTYDERIERTKKMIEKLFPEHTFSEDYLFWWCDEISQYPDGWVKYPKVIDRKDEIIDRNFNGHFLYESDAQGQHEHDAYLAINTHSFAATITKGFIGTMVDEDYTHLVQAAPGRICRTIERYYTNALPDKSYKLYDKEVSLKDAVKYANDFFNNEYKEIIPDLPTDFDISAVEVMNYNDIYCYNFRIRNTFENIPIDYHYDSGSLTDMSDGKDYAWNLSDVFMVKSDDLDHFFMDHPYTKAEYDGEAITKIISLEDAIKITSEAVSKSVSFSVLSAEFVYCPSYEGSALENGLTAKPSWKITLFNKNDNKHYIFYVDAVTGESRYFTSAYDRW